MLPAAANDEGVTGLPDPAREPTISVERAGSIFRISRASAYEGVRTGEIPSIRIGRRILVPMAALLRMLDTGADPRSAA